MIIGTSGQEPSKIKPEYAPEESFLGDGLSERDRDRIQMKALSCEAYGLRLVPHVFPFSMCANMGVNISSASI